MKFSYLSLYFKKIESTASRLTITRLLAELFQKIDEREIGMTLYLLQGRVAPPYVKLEFGMAEKMVIKAVAQGLHLEKKSFENYYKRIGDIGKTVEVFRKEIRLIDEKDLTITQVYKDLKQAATSNGLGSQETKINILAHLIRQLDPLSACYLVRIPLGRMRLGFSEMTVLDAFSWMLTGDKSQRPIIEKAYHVRPDLGVIGEVIKKEGIRGLKKIKPSLFTPILMMRAERLSSAKEILEKIGQCAIENKYDGFRLQVHYKKEESLKEVRLYSRNLEEVSYMYPDIIEGVKKEVKAESAIFEGEAIGFDPQTGAFLPFQETAQRKRKYQIVEKAKEIPLKLFVFELLYLNGENYISIPFAQRRKKLVEIIRLSSDPTKDTILVSPEEITADEKKIELLFDEAISKGLEGVLAKKLDGTYQPGARGWNWIKYKRSYSANIEDTIDCLVMGYDYGKGKRAAFGIGAFLAGVYDKEEDKYVTVAKIGTGLTDEEWKKLKVESAKLKVENKPAVYDADKMMECDVWISPSLVVEIKADEITKSPVHTAGRKLKTSKSGKAYEVDIPGFALRFPRLVRFREDKRPEDTTSLAELEKMFKRQWNNNKNH